MISQFAALVLGTFAIMSSSRWSPPTCDVLHFCRCSSASMRELSPQALIMKQRDDADAVVLGTVTRVDTLPAPILGGLNGNRRRVIVARLRVERTWRGAHADTISVAYGSLGSRTDCDILLVRGQSYAVFAQLGARGMLWTRQCMGTVPVADGDSVVTALDRAAAPTRDN
jgi:hypothetical protein